MGEKQCGKCGESVDEAKAFCPGCGNSFVQEKERTSVSEFDQLDHTVRLGDTMYNQLLSDMGLSISKRPNKEQKQMAEAAAAAVPSTPASNSRQGVEPPPAASANRRSAIIVIAAVAAIALAVLAAIAVIGIFYSR